MVGCTESDDEGRSDHTHDMRQLNIVDIVDRPVLLVIGFGRAAIVEFLAHLKHSKVDAAFLSICRTHNTSIGASIAPHACARYFTCELISG